MHPQARFAALFFATVGLCPAFALAQARPDTNAASRQGDAIQNQQQLQLQRDQQAAHREPAPNGADLKQLTPHDVPAGQSASCQDVQTIVLVDAPSFSDAALAQLNHDYAGKCLSVKDIEAILASVTRFYIEKGNITTRAYLPEQDLRTHRLIIKVVIGVVQKITVDDGGKHSVSVDTVFPGTAGKAFNLRDFEQGIDQINRLLSNNAQLDITPGDAPGQSIVVVHNQLASPLHLLATYDNQGSTNTGTNQAAATIGLDNMLGLDDYVSATHRSSVPSDGANNSSTSDVNFSLPFGYMFLTLDANTSRYESLFTAPSGQQLLSSGDTQNRSISINRVNYRNQDSRWSTSATFTAKSAHNYLAGQLLTVNSRKLSVFDLGTNYSTTLAGGFVVGQIDYQRGLDADNALKDMAGLAKASPHGQFNKWTLDLNFTRNFAALGQDFSFNSHFSGQYAPQALFGSEQIAIGGIYSVRGFNNTIILGDRGYFIRNELSLLKTFTVGTEHLATRWHAGLDYGHVRSVADGVQEGSLSGASIGWSINLRSVTVDLFESSPLTLPGQLKRESAQTWFRLSCAL